MTPDELQETGDVLATMLTALRGTLQTATGEPAADLFYAIGDLATNFAAVISVGQFGASLITIFNLSVSAGATIATMEQVRLAMMAETPVTVPGIAVANAGIRMALAAEAKILAATTFASRQAVDAALSALNDAFESAEDYAADNQAPDVYQALIGAHAAAVRDLTTRARPLPKLITYRMARVMTSHALANRLYGDASRCDELVAENGVVAPAFMPITGSALSE